MKFFVCVGMMIVLLGIWVAVGTAQIITATDMPDANLRAAVLAQLKATTPAIVDSTATTFTRADMANSRFSFLRVRYTTITDLTGLEHAASNLKQLNFLDTGITNITPVASLTALIQLYIMESQITTIPDLSGLTNLTLLNLRNNSITAIPATLPISLRSLRLDGNRITAIPNLSSLTNLREVYLKDNLITAIPVTNLPASITKLELSGNRITAVPNLSSLISLTLLDLSDNSITTVPNLSNPATLKTLRLNYNRITAIPALPSSLTSLAIGDNLIADIPNNLPISLTDLFLQGNKIKDITNVGRLTNLMFLSLHRNLISDLTPLSALPNLLQLHLFGNRITKVSEFQKLSSLPNQPTLYLCPTFTDYRPLLDNQEELRACLYVPPPPTGTFEDDLEDPSIEVFTLTIRFPEPVTGFEKEDIIIKTELHTGVGIATLEALTPTTGPAQTYIATIRLPTNAAGTVTITVRAEAAETQDGRLDPIVDRAFPPIPFSTLPPPDPGTEAPKRRIIFQCPVGWQKTDRFAGRTRRVLIYEIKLEMDTSNRISIYKPISVAIYVHPDEGLENLDGWKLQVALPYNHHRDYLLTAENSVVVDSHIEGVDGGFAFIKNPEEAPFPMTGMGFTGALVPGFDYRLYDDTGRKVDFGISCYKRVDIFQVLKDMEDPRVLRKVLLETLDWDSPYIRTEWTVPVPVNVPGSPSLPRVNLVGKWADLKKQ